MTAELIGTWVGIFVTNFVAMAIFWSTSQRKREQERLEQAERMKELETTVENIGEKISEIKETLSKLVDIQFERASK